MTRNISQFLDGFQCWFRQVQDIAKARQFSQLCTNELRFRVLQDRESNRVGRFGGANEVFNALAGRNDRAVPLACSPECIEDLIPENRIGQHRPHFIKYCDGGSQGSACLFSANLLVDGPRNSEGDRRL